MKINAGPSGLAVISLQKVDSLLDFEYDMKLKRFLQDDGDVMPTSNLFAGF